MPIEQERTHRACKGQMQPIAIGSNIKASEWYCHSCHKSEPMDRETAQHFIQLRVKMMQAQMQRAAG